MTSTPMVKQADGTVDPKVKVKKQEYVDWKHQFQTLWNAIVTQTNEVLLKTLNEHDKFQKRSKDLLDEEMADQRRELDSLKQSIDDDAVIHKHVIVAAPVYVDIPNPPTINVGRNMCNPHAHGTENYNWIIGHNDQPIYVPPNTEGNTTSSNISRISKKYERQATISFKSGTFAEYEKFNKKKGFKRTMRNMSKILDWDNDQFGKEVFLSLAGKAAECINDIYG